MTKIELKKTEQKTDNGKSGTLNSMVCGKRRNLNSNSGRRRARFYLAADVVSESQLHDCLFDICQFGEILDTQILLREYSFKTVLIGNKLL